MQDNPKISIIIPVYNIELYLRRCIESVIRQTYNNLEILIINDGSSDKSGEICDEFKSFDNRIKVFHKKNEGVSVARNLGLAHATGQYIGFVDGDDYIAPDMYDFLLKLILRENADIASCGYYNVKNEKLIPGVGVGKDFIFNKDQGIINCLNKKDFFGSSCLLLFNRNCIREISFDTSLKKSEDYLFDFLAYCNAEKSVHNGEPKYFYVWREGSALNSKSSVNLDAILTAQKIVEVVKDRFPHLESFAHLRDIIENVSVIYSIESMMKTRFNQNLIYQREEILKYLKKYEKHVFSKNNIPFKYKVLLAIKRINNSLFLKAIVFYLKFKKKDL